MTCAPRSPPAWSRSTSTRTRNTRSRAVAGHMLGNFDGVLKVDGGIGRKADYDPRSWGAKAEAALAAHVAGAARLFGSAGRSLLRS